jgi:hypothetical protein
LAEHCFQKHERKKMNDEKISLLSARHFNAVPLHILSKSK